MSKCYFLILFLMSGGIALAGSRMDRYISVMDFGSLGGIKPEVLRERIDRETVKVTLSWLLTERVWQDDWHITLTPDFKPDFHWAPHLTPGKGYIIGQHVFRSPAMIVQGEGKTLILIPDIGMMKKGTPLPLYMDLDAQKNQLLLGMSRQCVEEHVLYKREKGGEYSPGTLQFSFYLVTSVEEKIQQNPFRKVLAFLWEHWGEKQFEENEQQPASYEKYVQYTYDWAFRNWADQVWQEFEVKGNKVGAPVFIVNTTQSPNYPGMINEREFRSVWNQAWFSSLRSASGLFRYARRVKDDFLMQKALLTKELALVFPQNNGLFYGVIATEMEQVAVEGNMYNRSRGWETQFWGNSNRNPYTWDTRRAPFHILDMSWTALLMLRWYEELEKDERLLAYAQRYADRLLTLQSPEGYFPAWLDQHTLQVMPHLQQSPETSMSVTFLLKLYALTSKQVYKYAALRAMRVVMKEIVPIGRWEDFETYWSCCRLSMDRPGQKIARNNMYKQCNFSMFWTAEALLECYRLTGEKWYLKTGHRVLDEMLMTQASWQPPFIYVSTLGGFGVMNADGEWNDSRGSLFAELILDYGVVLKSKEYKQRGMAALRSSFSMMYCPENVQEKKQWEYAWPFFNEKDYGFTMENYGHGGATGPHGIGIGEFTIYDWGNGAAAEAYNRIFDHYPNRK